MAVAEFPLIDETLLKSRIYTIRGVKVMLDADLAEIYGYTTKAFNQQVKNNIEKFDDDFRFQLSSKEVDECSRSKILTLNGGHRGTNIKYAPYAFTEQGIYMLMTVLKGERATAQSKALIRLFKQMKDYIVAENHQLLGTAGIAQIAAQTVQNTRKIATVSAEVKELSGEVRDIRSDLGKINVDLRMVMENFVDPSSFRHFLLLNGHKLEADVAYAQIYGMAKKSVLIIDNYVNIQTLEKQKKPASSKTGNVIELCETLLRNYRPRLAFKERTSSSESFEIRATFSTESPSASMAFAISRRSSARPSTRPSARPSARACFFST